MFKILHVELTRRSLNMMYGRSQHCGQIGSRNVETFFLNIFSRIDFVVKLARSELAENNKKYDAHVQILRSCQIKIFDEKFTPVLKTKQLTTIHLNIVHLRVS